MRTFYIKDIRFFTKKIFEINFCISKLSFTFAVHKELRGYVCWSKSEKGIRCESGTIPVAVYLDSIVGVMFVAFFATGKYWEGATNEMSQKTYLCI